MHTQHNFLKLGAIFLCGLVIFISLLMIFKYHPTTVPASKQEETTATTTNSAPSDSPAAEPSIYLLDDAMQFTLIDHEPKPVYDTYSLAERKEKHLPTQLPKPTPYLNEKVVYLTFDDGPDNINTPKVLDILAQEQIKATFFILGQNALHYPEVVKRIFQENHALGNHTFDHMYGDLYRNPAAYLAQLQNTDNAIRQITGVRPIISRAPGGTDGHFNQDFWNALKQNGYIEVGWNISSGDASTGKAADLIENITRQINERPYLASHSIILMHSSQGHDETVRALPQIIKLFKDRGYTFAVVNPTTPEAW